MNIDQVLESDVSDSKEYTFVFKTTKLSSTGEEKLVQGNITTDPILNDKFGSKSMSLSGKLRYFMDGVPYCDEKISHSDCSFDARLMTNNGRFQVRIVDLVIFLY